MRFREEIQERAYCARGETVVVVLVVRLMVFVRPCEAPRHR
jgi:hypothetical protein